MKKIGIITTEVADLPHDIIQKYQIGIVPAKLDWPEIENIPGDNTFQKMRELEKRGIKSFGKTSQPSPNDFIEAYKYQFAKFEKVLCSTLSSKHSGTYNSAILGRNFLDPKNQKRVFVVDSLSGTAGEALFVLKAVDLIEEGKEIEDVVKELKKFIPKNHLYLILADPKWLEASGRISHLIASLLRRMAKAGIRAMLELKKGTIKPSKIKIGAHDIPNTLFKTLEKATNKLRREGKKIRTAIVHGDDPKGAQRLKEMIEEELENTEVVFVNVIDNIIGAPLGPDTLALAWCEI